MQKVLALDANGQLVEVVIVQQTGSSAIVDGGSPTTVTTAPFLTVDFGGVT
jgi:hypothetical protein